MGHKKNLEDMEFNGWDQLDSDIMWASEVYCAEKLGISVDTLVRRIKEKHNMTFAEYKNKKQETLRINILRKQYDVALQGNVSMLIWLGKNMCGQSDKVQGHVSIPTIRLAYGMEDESSGEE